MSIISIVVPVYYNSASLPALSSRLATLASNFPAHQFEFIYVDDGSGDGSYDVLQQLAKKDNRIRLIKLARNFGSNTAIMAGISYAKGDCVGFVAADLQDPPETLGEMITQWEAGSKVTFAMRHDRQGDPWLTRTLAEGFNYLFSKFVFDRFSPQGIGFFLVDKQVAEVLIQCHEKNAHVIGLILWTGFTYTIVEYDRVEREHGKSRWTLGKKLKYSIDAFAAFSYLPLRLASALGLLMAVAGGIYAIVVVVIRLLNRVPVPGWTALMVVVLLAAGAQLLILGIIGEYLWRNLDASRHRPLFVVDSSFNMDEESVEFSSVIVPEDDDIQARVEVLGK